MDVGLVPARAAPRGRFLLGLGRLFIQNYADLSCILSGQRLVCDCFVEWWGSRMARWDVLYGEVSQSFKPVLSGGC